MNARQRRKERREIERRLAGFRAGMKGIEGLALEWAMSMNEWQEKMIQGFTAAGRYIMPCRVHGKTRMIEQIIEEKLKKELEGPETEITVSIDGREPEGEMVFSGVDLAKDGDFTALVESIRDERGRILDAFRLPVELIFPKQKGGGGGSEEEKPI